MRGKNRLHKVAITEKIDVSDQQVIVGQTHSSREALVKGDFISHKSKGAFNMHACRVQELIDSNVVATAPKSCILSILLKGRLGFSYDNLEFQLSASNGPVGVLVNLNKPANFRRQIIKDNHLIKINISMSPTWLSDRLSQQSATQLLLDKHLSYIQFPVDDTLANLVLKTIDSKKDTTRLHSMKLESLALSMMASALDQVEIQPLIETESAVTPSHSCSIEDVISYIELNLAHAHTLESLSAHFSMSVSNLQRRFRQEIGVTVNNYIRTRRLDLAKQHLERGLVSITEAAYEAGYNHPANFTIAFKKAYGIPPAELPRK